MKKTQSNSNAMGVSVDTTLEQNHSIWAGDVILTENVELNKANLGDIAYWGEQQANGIISLGYSRDKEVLKLLLIDEAMRMVGAVKSYGAQTGNYAIFSQINYQPSQLAKMKTVDFENACKRVHDVATDNLSVLGDYGVTAPKLTLLMADITAYKTLVPKIRATIVNEKVATKNLGLAVKKMIKNLKERIDNNMQRYRGSDFYLAYKASRRTINLNSATTGLEGIVMDQATGKIIKHCFIEVLLPEGNRQTSVNTKGHYTFKRLEMERCTIRVRAPYYTSAEFEIELTQGKMTHREIVMVAETVTAAMPVNA